VEPVESLVPVDSWVLKLVQVHSWELILVLEFPLQACSCSAASNVLIGTRLYPDHWDHRRLSFRLPRRGGI
jgi:hypothetical protein